MNNITFVEVVIYGVILLVAIYLITNLISATGTASQQAAGSANDITGDALTVGGLGLGAYLIYFFFL